MKYLTLILTTIFLFSSPVVWSEEVDYDDLVIRGGLYYKKFSEEPFTGTVCCQIRGKLVKGKEEGKWVWFWDNGQLYSIQNYKNGRLHGLREMYYESGKLKRRHHFKDDIYHCLTEDFYENGQLEWRGHHKNGKGVGKWEYYDRYGTLEKVEDKGEGD